jgi:hypothetical protein
MFLALAPLEILLAIGLFYALFYLFRKLLNSKKLTSVIEEVAHPAAVTEDEVVEAVEDNLKRAAQVADEGEEEIARKKKKVERLRKAYGGK